MTESKDSRKGIIMLKRIFITKAICLFMSMDKMVGGQFEMGLASIKSIVETAAKP